MPGWQREVQDLVDAGELNVLGILQEQHGDRARLFHQWQGLNFPLLVDSFNELGVKVGWLLSLLQGLPRPNMKTSEVVAPPRWSIGLGLESAAASTASSSAEIYTIISQN